MLFYNLLLLISHSQLSEVIFTYVKVFLYLPPSERVVRVYVSSGSMHVFLCMSSLECKFNRQGAKVKGRAGTTCFPRLGPLPFSILAWRLLCLCLTDRPQLNSSGLGPSRPPSQPCRFTEALALMSHITLLSC